MRKKIGKSKKCFCGSGKNFKNCHGAVQSKPLIQASYKFVDIQFLGSFFEIKKHGIQLTCEVSMQGEDYSLLMYIVPGDDGEWKLIGRRWVTNRPNLEEKDFLQTMVNKAASIIKTTNMWAGEQTPQGGKVKINQMKVPDEDLEYNSVSFRSNLLNMPSPLWRELWSRIDNRVEYDSFFRIHGFSKEEIRVGIDQLKKVFPWEWVRTQYKKPRPETDPSMGAHFPPEIEGTSWFPAYHLARTALGAICVDPGWNYLLEIGLSINDLSNFPKINTLLRQVTRSPGTQHHLCLAAELHKRGLLKGLEPPTGAGSATNDLLVNWQEQTYAIEVKEFNLNNPLKKLKTELQDKVLKLPKVTKTSVIFHIVLREGGERELKGERAFFEKIEQIADEIPVQISAVVAGARFVDSTGGRVKRETSKIILNPKAINPSDESNLQEIFKNNYDEIVYPTSGIGTFFYFSNSEQ
jgi:hypothetical protein